MTYKLLFLLGLLMIMFGWGSCDYQAKPSKSQSHINRDSLDSVYFIRGKPIQANPNNHAGKIPSNNN